MHVAIHGHRGTYFVVALQAADCHGYIVDHAEPLAVVGKGVMKASANVDRDAIAQRVLRRQYRPTGGEPECLHQFRRKGNFQLQFFARAQRAGLQLVYILGLVDQQNVLIRGGLGIQKVAGLCDARFQQPVVNAPVFFGREDVLADGEIVAVAVNQFEGKHVCVPMILRTDSSHGVP